MQISMQISMQVSMQVSMQKAYASYHFRQFEHFAYLGKQNMDI